MVLTTAQRATLKADILANSDALALYNVGSLGGLADLYNANVSAFIVWRSLVPITEVGNAFVATELSGLTTANSSRLQALALYSSQGINASLADRRGFFDDVFSVGGLTMAKLAVVWRRSARRIEKVFATGTGTDASPATLVVEGSILYQDFVDL